LGVVPGAEVHEDSLSSIEFWVIAKLCLDPTHLGNLIKIYPLEGMGIPVLIVTSKVA
jgi:hypothetical protein